MARGRGGGDSGLEFRRMTVPVSDPTNVEHKMLWEKAMEKCFGRGELYIPTRELAHIESI